ncbi:hypothetical protein ABE61_24080 [Lysinibacillus sphaericus]|nr:hypothetical protein [Lysinibacillus sphaericus]MBG9480486.1 hypothetical protein [Lysinibacillus sphaericus]MBG9593034.1 hypothetical protein [Lysinibacillus sphaericus]
MLENWQNLKRGADVTDRCGVTTDECSEATVRKAGVMDRTHQNLWIPFKATVWWALSMDVGL